MLMLWGAAGRAGADPLAGDFVSGQVIAKVRPTANVKNVNATYGTTTLDEFSDGSGVYLVEVSAGSNVKNMTRRMAGDRRLLYAEPNFKIQPLEGDARHRAWGVSDVAPSSEDYVDSALNLSIARKISWGKGVTVAVLDTGAQLGHPTLQPNFEGVKRWDFVGNDPNPTDVLDADRDGRRDRMAGHGTHVAGIVDRVAPAAKIMPLRVLNSKGYGDAFTIAKAVSYAQRNGAKVINLSLGSSSYSKLLYEMIGNAINSGVVVAAAAGNSNTSAPHYPAAGDGLIPTGMPASADGLIAVTSVTSLDQEKQRKSDFANYGGWVDIAAPGEEIRSAFPVEKYADWSGTSMSTPFIAGQAALIRAVDGSLEAKGLDGIEARIRDTVDPLSPQPEYAGTGHANVCKSLGG